MNGNPGAKIVFTFQGKRTGGTTVTVTKEVNKDNGFGPHAISFTGFSGLKEFSVRTQLIYTPVGSPTVTVTGPNYLDDIEYH